MRRILLFVLLSASAFAQLTAQVEGPDFSRGSRPRGSFYLNGVGHQYLQGANYTVIAAAIPVLNGKFFGVKVHVINRGTSSVDVVPESITAEDSVAAKQMAMHSSVEVNDKMQRPSGLARAAGIVAGEPIGMPGGSSGPPTMNDLLRELLRDAAAESPWGAADATPTLTPRGAARATAASSPTCDLGCELRNREIGDGNGPQLARRTAKPEQVEQAELLANTVPPLGDVEGVLYFAMPKMTDKAPVSHHGRKSYQVTVTVPVGDEKFQFVFPPE
jgi:hypothetical protein